MQKRFFRTLQIVLLGFPVPLKFAYVSSILLFFFVFSATWRDYVYTLWYCTQTVPDKRRKLDRMETSNYSRCREGENKRAQSQDGNQD